VERLDLSDNGIEDKDGLCIIRCIKKMAEMRDSAIWRTGLRQNSQAFSNDDPHIINLANEGNSPSIQ